MMKKIILLTVYAAITASTVFGQCSSLFSFTANFETLNFSNQSNVSNAHYFWNFGDGTGSNLQNPVHVFPEKGRYLITLFVNDTVSNCSDYYENKISITKFSNDICQPDSILDSISYNGGSQALYLNLIDNSSLNCSGYSEFCDAGVSSMMPSPAYLSILNNPARYVGRIRFQSAQNRELYKTIPYRYSSAKNYDSCSANFEFKTVSQDANGQRILFTAMNKSAGTYKWHFFDLMTQLTSTSDTVSSYFPFSFYSNKMFTAMLQTVGSTGCKDTLIQTIRIQSKQTITGVKEYGSDILSLNIYPNPTKDKIVVISSNNVRKMTLVNALGQEVVLINKPIGEQEINISLLPEGIYFLKAESKEGQGVFKIVKE